MSDQIVSASPRVLVAEDGVRQCAELVQLLKNMGFQDVTAASTAHEAIRFAVQLRPDIVVLDGLLPGMHGFEVARFIRNIDTTYRPRIVFATAIYKNVRYENDAKLKYGIDAYIVKPITRDALRGAMGSLAA
jgi:CheY-like chemotaxis protein